MITISQAVKEIVRQSPFISEVLAEGIANISSIARQIQPQIEKKLFEEVSEEAVAMALRRLPKVKLSLSGQKFLKNLTNITLRSNLVEFIFLNPVNIAKLHQEILHETEQSKDGFLNLSRGLFESIVIVSSEFEKNVNQILKNQKKITKIRNLSSVTIKLPSETITTPGVYYPILKALAWERLNIIEVISIGSELSIIFNSKDIDRAFSVIKSLTS